jgi:DNA-binding MarR family transcriptional regulator
VKWLTAAEVDSWLSVVRLITWMSWSIDQQLQRYSNLGMVEYQVLAMLSNRPEWTMRMSALAEVTNASLSRLSHLIKRLESRGLVRREPDPSDRRFTNAILTDEGFRTLADAAPGHVAHVRSLVIDVLSPEQLRRLGLAADRIMSRIDTSGNPVLRRPAGATLVRLAAEPLTAGRFSGRIEHVPVGNLELSAVMAGSQHVRRTRSLITQGNEEYLLASIQQRGIGRVEQDGRAATRSPGDFAFSDSTRPYTLHFDKSQVPPVNAFWSLTMYNDKQAFVANPMNRYAIGDRDAPPGEFQITQGIVTAAFDCTRAVAG